MKITLGKKILAGFITCGIILCGVSIFTFNNSKKFVSSNAWVDHTYKVLQEFQQVLLYVVDAETGGRGYIISGDDHFLEPYNTAKVNIFEHIETLKRLTADNEFQHKNVEKLEKHINIHINYLDGLIVTSKKDIKKAIALVSSGEGKRITDEIRRIIADAIDTEKKLLAERKSTSEAEADNFNTVFSVLLVVILILLAVVYYIIITNLKALRRAEAETANKNWLLTGNSQLNDKINGEKEIGELANEVISQLSVYTRAQLGVIYVEEKEQLYLAGGYAHDAAESPATLKFGQGLVGQAAEEKRLISLTDIPDDYIKIKSGTGNSLPKHIVIFPFQYANQVKGVIELASLTTFTEFDIQFLQMVAENIGIAVNSSQSRSLLKILLEETQQQSRDLIKQQEELNQINEELEEQASLLKQQQEELQMTNEELEEQTQSLEIRNKDLESARIEIERQTKQLEISSKYKSEFLANMSHELRTPLNSLLILSKDLADNKKGNLSADQKESAEIINKSGHDLLILINEVLDLSKIEAGKMTINPEKISVNDFANNLKRNFNHQAEQKQLKFVVNVSPQVPEFIVTDEQRLDQVLKNLLSNAIKFTDKGKVTVNFREHAENKLAIEVVDTGVGIPEEKQLSVFEAFQQADGGTSRKYGGTGLGLSISRELTKLLEGRMTLQSKPGEGSVFTLIIPYEVVDKPAVRSNENHRAKQPPVVFEKNKEFINYPAAPDDREQIKKDDRTLLIIEDDMRFAQVLIKHAREKGFKCISAATGEDGLLHAEKYHPHAIILDLELPGINGQTVLTELKSNPVIRHIPVHIVSAKERSLDLIKEGAVEYLSKPIDKKQLEEAFSRIENFISRKMKNLLIIEDNENSRTAIKKLIGNGDVKCLEAATGREALTILKDTYIDCIILDLMLPDMSGFEIIRTLEKTEGFHMPPIVVYTGKELSKEENNELEHYSESIIIKGIKSEERLLDETALFLHRTVTNMPPMKQQVIMNLYNREAIFQDKKILLVDDDMRNVFALAKVLKERGMDIIKAENGNKALEALKQEKGFDIVLMDIMMPEMDGYETMRRIRAQQQFKDLPIIALTAKAMKDDRQKCIDAGANDYITKPVDLDRLLTLMRVWLSK